MKFKIYFESKNFNLNVYYKLLNDFLNSRKGWSLKKIPNDSYNQMEIVDDDGKRYGKIERDYDPETKTLHLNHIGVGFDENGQRMKGLGLVNLVYNFEKQIVQMYGIEKVCTEPVNEITDKKFKETYKDYKIDQKDNYICAFIK
jgi:hypothetical protein